MIIPPRLHGQASWPGVLGVNAFSGTMGLGTSPGVYTLTIPPQPGLLPATNGVLAISDGANTVVLAGCRLDSLEQVRQGESYVWTLQILDRRWKWQFGSVSGTFNVRDAANVIYPATLANAPQLATYCLQAMGETGFDVSILPAGEFPPIDWDHEIPAVALTQLVEQYGCRVVYRPSLNGARDTVVICQIGRGSPMPNGPVVRSSPGLDTPEAPAGLLFVGGPTRYESLFVLEAVGEDLDGSIVPIDDLSYTPESGWEFCGPPSFAAIRKSIVNLDPNLNQFDDPTAVFNAIKAACDKSVFRYYRIKWQGLDGVAATPSVPEVGAVDYRWQLLLEHAILDQVIKPDGTTADKPAEVYGNAFFFSPNRKTIDRDQFGNTSNYERIDVEFQIDQQRGLVIFSQPMYLRQVADLGGGNSLTTAEPADLRLRCTVQVRDKSELNRYQIVRHEEIRPLNTGTVTPFEVVSRPMLQRKVKGNYQIENSAEPSESGRWKLTSTTDNMGEIDLLIRDALDAAEVQYQIVAVNDTTFAGILPIPLDGALQQITWSFSTEQPPTTQIGQNTEHAYWLPTYEEKRRVTLTRPRRGEAGPAVTRTAVAAAAGESLIDGSNISAPKRIGALFRALERQG